MKIKASYLKNLSRPEKRYDLVDSAVPGLTVRVNTGAGNEDGSKPSISFRLRYYLDGGEQKMTIGHFRRRGHEPMSLVEARKVAREYRVMVDKGLDPACPEPEVAQAPKNFGALVEWWYTSEAAENRSRDDQRLLLSYLPSSWKRMSPQEITTGHVVTFHRGATSSRGPYQANRIVATLSSVMRSARRYRWIAENPCLDFTYNQEYPRERFLEFEELRALWRACDERASQGARIIQLVLLTGSRRTEIMAARWDEIRPTEDHTIGELHLQPERVKTGRKRRTTHVVHLARTAREIITALPRGNSPYLFPSPRGGGQLVTIKKAKSTIARDAARLLALSRGLPAPESVDDVRRIFPQWDFRDLRRTMTTLGAAAGIPGHFLSLAVNHARPTSAVETNRRMARTTARHYVAPVANRMGLVRDFDREGMVSAWVAWDEHLRGIVDHEGGDLLRFDLQKSAIASR